MISLAFLRQVDVLCIAVATLGVSPVVGRGGPGARKVVGSGYQGDVGRSPRQRACFPRLRTSVAKPGNPDVSCAARWPCESWI